MIDTIKIYIPNDQLPDNFYNQEYLKFKNKSITEKDTGEIWSTFMFHNFVCTHNSYGISMSGSISRYFYGTNQYTITRDDFIIAIEQLSQEINVDLKNCNVTRLDISENIITQQPVENYYRYLGETKYFTRTKLSHGIEYRNTNRYILFYNKIKKLRKDRTPITPLFNGKNMLRLEYRLQNGNTVAKAMGMHRVKVIDIINNYQKLSQLWVGAFHSIFKNHDIMIFDSSAFIGKEFEKQLVLSGINALGGGQYVLELIKEARKMKLFKYNNQATNLTRRIKTILQTPVLTRKSTLMDELNRKVRIASFVAFSYNMMERSPNI